MANISDLPNDLPIPLDNGECDHLTGLTLPEISLPSTKGGSIHLASLDGITIGDLYKLPFYPISALD